MVLTTRADSTTKKETSKAGGRRKMKRSLKKEPRSSSTSLMNTNPSRVTILTAKQLRVKTSRISVGFYSALKRLRKLNNSKKEKKFPDLHLCNDTFLDMR